MPFDSEGLFVFSEDKFIDALCASLLMEFGTTVLGPDSVAMDWVSTAERIKRDLIEDGVLDGPA